MTKDQISFLKFHADEPWPHKWEWLGGNDPKSWDRLRADKRNSHRVISRDELAQLSDFGYLRGFKVTDEGRAALAKAVAR